MAVRAVLDTQVVVRGLLGIRRSACAVLFDALGALEGDAEYLVTDDAGLLRVKVLSVSGYHPLQIIAPGPFVRQVLDVKEPAAP